MFKYILPLILFIAIAVFLALGLKLKPNEIPSPLLNKSAPAFSAAKLMVPSEKLSPENMKGKVWLFNVWASWCVSCREEHPVLNQFAKQHPEMILIGLNYKDRPEDAQKWLNGLGNPYSDSVMDQDGRIGLDYGVYGVPETFVIDKKGVVRYKHTGPVRADDIEQIFMPLITQLQAEA
jgi:cytochrome c biogenesis protein CcmG, thiol:disulfide interchange protein DsbE